MFLIGVWNLDLNLDMVIGLSDTNVLNLALYLDFEDAKNLHVL